MKSEVRNLGGLTVHSISRFDDWILEVAREAGSILDGDSVHETLPEGPWIGMD